jgi:hypothetical protein
LTGGCYSIKTHIGDPRRCYSCSEVVVSSGLTVILTTNLFVKRENAFLEICDSFLPPVSNFSTAIQSLKLENFDTMKGAGNIEYGDIKNETSGIWREKQQQYQN